MRLKIDQRAEAFDFLLTLGLLNDLLRNRTESSFECLPRGFLWFPLRPDSRL